MSALTVAEVLDRAADLIEPEGAWTQGAFARNPVGKEVDGGSPDASCWCVYGALDRVMQQEFEGDPENVFGDLVAATHGMAIPQFNDAPGRTQAEVVAALRAAAEKARAT